MDLLVIKTRASDVVNGFSLAKTQDCVHLLNVLIELEREKHVTRRLTNALDKANEEIVLLKRKLASKPEINDFSDLFGAFYTDKK